MRTGTSADPFFVDLALWRHVVDALQHRRPTDLADWNANRARNSFAGSHVEAIVVEVPYATDSDLPTRRPIGVWARTVLATDDGGWRQVDRVAVPFVGPLLRALGGDDDLELHGAVTSAPLAADLHQEIRPFTRMLAALVRRSGVGDPDTYARTVIKRLLPDILPYTVATPASFSFAGFNGRRLSDNAAEVMLGLVTNSAVPTGLTTSGHGKTWQDLFPYVLLASP